jgi:hypothetical protein
VGSEVDVCLDRAKRRSFNPTQWVNARSEYCTSVSQSVGDSHHTRLRWKERKNTMVEGVGRRRIEGMKQAKGVDKKETIR